MPAPIATAAAMITCIHGGTVMITPGQTQVTIGGSPILCSPTLMTCPIVGCAQIGPGIVPCTMIIVAEPVFLPSPVVQVGGMPAYTVAAIGTPGGLTNGNPPGMIMCTNPGQVIVMG
jgi:hypothetical protein